MTDTNVKKLVNSGFIVDEKIAEKINNLNNEDFNNLTEQLKKDKAFLVSEDIINKVLVKEIDILKQYNPLKTFTVQDVVKTLNERYNFLQKILLNKIELKNVVSINKASNGYVSIIGLVKDIVEKNTNKLVVLEDPTGDIETLIDKKMAEKLSLDDVVAVSGNINNKILFVKKIFFPNIPIKPVNYSKESVKIAFLSGKEKVDADYVVYKNKIKDRIKNKTVEITNPCFIKIKDIKILIALGSDPLTILNKRYLNKENTDFLLDAVPDVLLTDKKINMSYKGVSIVSLDNIIDLKTREVRSID